MSSISESSSIELSICITTFNRGHFIGATLDSILGQIGSTCEVVVLDGASSDDTEAVVSGYCDRTDRLRYIRQRENNGLDSDLDRAVELARGKYCWLMTDDDLLRPSAVAAVMGAIGRDVSLIILNEEVRDITMSRVLQHCLRRSDVDRSYKSEQIDEIFVDVGGALNCNCVVIRRSIWLERDRKRYYGSLFIHMGVIFQRPLPGETLLIAEPLISFRAGNAHSYSPRMAELIWEKWPLVVSSLAVSDEAKRAVHAAEPWRKLQTLLDCRGLNWYSLAEYRQWIRPRLRSVREAFIPALVARLPGPFVNLLLISYYSLQRHQGARLQRLRESRFYLRNWFASSRRS